MNIEKMRSVLAEFQDSAKAISVEIKDSQSVLFELFQFYECLDDSGRTFASQVVAEWVASDDEGLPGCFELAPYAA